MLARRGASQAAVQRQQPRRPRPASCRVGQPRRAFTLIELLVVVSVILLLISMLVPALGQARLRAKIVRVHSDLRQIGLAIDSYAIDNREGVPITRQACGENIECQLPPELARGGYLPPPPPGEYASQSHYPDLFNPRHTYKYRAPGAVYYGGILFDFPQNRFKNRSWIWVPSDFPTCADPNMSLANRYGLFPDEEPRCPVRYAVWSMGPDPKSSLFPRQEGQTEVDELRFPLLRAWWWQPGRRAGLITHFTDRGGRAYQSP